MNYNIYTSVCTSVFSFGSLNYVLRYESTATQLVVVIT